MTAVLDYVIFALIGFSVLAALFFVVKGVLSRSQTSREAYGVGQQESRRTMQISMVRGVSFVFVALVLLGVYGLNSRLAGLAPEPTEPPPTAPPVVDTSTPSPTVTTAVPTSKPTITPTNPPLITTSEPDVPTETPEPEPIEPTPTPATAAVTSEVGVWLRGEPNADGAQLEWVLNGTRLIVLPGLETTDEYTWQQVRTPDGNEGWVATEFIEYN